MDERYPPADENELIDSELSDIQDYAQFLAEFGTDQFTREELALKCDHLSVRYAVLARRLRGVNDA